MKVERVIETLKTWLVLRSQNQIVTVSNGAVRQLIDLLEKEREPNERRDIDYALKNLETFSIGLREGHDEKKLLIELANAIGHLIDSLKNGRGSWIPG